MALSQRPVAAGGPWYPQLEDASLPSLPHRHVASPHVSLGPDSLLKRSPVVGSGSAQIQEVSKLSSISHLLRSNLQITPMLRFQGAVNLGGRYSTPHRWECGLVETRPRGQGKVL